MRDFPGSLRQESPSPPSTLNTSISSNAPKPPTPTSSPPPPTHRPRTAQGAGSPVRQNFDMDSDPEDHESPERPPTPPPDSPVRDTPPSPTASNGSPDSRSRSKTVSRTQSLKEPLVQKFGTVFSYLSQEKRGKAEAVKEAEKALSSATHSRPIIVSQQKSRGSDSDSGDVFTKEPEQPLMHSRDSPSPDIAVVQPSDDVGSADDQPDSSQAIQLSSSSSTKGPGNRSGVVVPESSSSFLHQLRSKKSPQTSAVEVPLTSATSEGERETELLPNRESPPFDREKKSSPSRVVTPVDVLNRGTGAGSNASSSSSASSKMPRAKPNRLRRNVQVLPDRKILKEKAASSECLADCGLPPTNPLTTHRKREGSQESLDQSVTHTPRPPLGKRPVVSTDSDENNSETDTATGVAILVSRNSNLPPRCRSAALLKKTKSKSGSSSGPGSQRTSPLGGVLGKRDTSPSQADSGIALRPEDTDEFDSLPEDQVQSDGDASPKLDQGSSSRLRSSPSGGGSGTGSQELITVTDNRTVPQIRHPMARQSSKASTNPTAGPAPSGSPPKTVTWKLRPDILNYKGESSGLSQSVGDTLAGSRGSGSSSAPHGGGRTTHRSHCDKEGHPRRHSSDDSKQDVSPQMQIMVHESFLEQSSMILKQQVQALDDLKDGRKSMQAYKEVTVDILNIHEQAVRRMLEFLKKSDS